MDVKDVLEAALKAVGDARVPPELRALAFEKAIDLVATPTSAQALPVANGTGLNGSQLTRAATGGSLMGRLAARLHASPEAIEAVFTENAGAVEVTVDPKRLSQRKSTGTRELALLVAASRQVLGEEATPADEIRKVAEDYDRLDAPNFASALADLKGKFLPSGSPRARLFKLSKPGWDEVGSLVARLGGEANGS